MGRLLIIFLLLPFGVQAQIQDTLYTASDTLCLDSTLVVPEYDIFEELATPPLSGNGEANLHDTPAINNLLRWHIYENKQKKSFTGYRIQLYSVNSYGCDLEKLKEYRDNFETEFQDIPAYLQYFNPDFKIRAGNYHSRLESIPALHRIRKKYPSSYPVKTEITLEELKRIPRQDILQDSTAVNVPDSTFLPLPRE